MALTTVQQAMVNPNPSTQTFGFKNRLINGGMVIDQRNAGASVTPTTNQTYTLDRWQVELSQASKFSVQQSTTAPAGFKNSLLITSLSAYSVGASDYFMLNQTIEGFNIADLNWGTANASTVTLSFWVRSSLTGTFGGGLENNATNRDYVFSYTINSANTWEQKSITIAGDTSGTWATDNNAGIRLRLGLGVGSTLSTTPGSWGSTRYFSATGATSVVGTNGATFYITGVQLESGSTATGFDFRSYGTELDLCQRYYETGNNSFYLPVVSGNAVGAVNFKLTKRATPSVTTVYAGTSASGVSASTNGITWVLYGTSLVQVDSWTASAEL